MSQTRRNRVLHAPIKEVGTFDAKKIDLAYLWIRVAGIQINLSLFRDKTFGPRTRSTPLGFILIHRDSLPLMIFRPTP